MEVAPETDATAVGGLLERAGELAVLAEALETVEQTARGRVLLVGGEAGGGKTSLVRAFAGANRETRILWGACDPLFTPRPLGPLLAVAESAGGELEHVVASEARPHEVVAALSRTLAACGPSIFVLEDVHWADEATLDVLRLLARRVESVPALIVVTYRDELDRSHPLRIVLGELATNGAVRRLKLAPLSRDAVETLAEPHEVDAYELYDKTGGNPFFVVEALAVGAERIPDTVRDAVLARTAPLSPDARMLLDAAAVVPSRAELWLLEALAGAALGSLDECLASGILTSEQASVTFRHELARLAIEGSIAANRKIELHRKALAVLAAPPGGAVDSARLAHHAEAAGDGEAVLRFAPAAGALAASRGAYREAAAQYARALRFGGHLTLAERADLLEQRSYACYLTDQNDAAIAAAEERVACRRELGDELGEGDALRWLSQIMWCPGRTDDSEHMGLAAVELLETLAPGRELAAAYANLAHICVMAARFADGAAMARRALELAEQVGDKEVALHADVSLAGLELPRKGPARLERNLELARREGFAEQVARGHISCAATALGMRDYDLAARHAQEGIDYCSERGLERDRLYLLAFRARVELDQGRWAEAAESAAAVLRVPRTSITPRIVALIVLALVRARRGDPEVTALLDEAWALAWPTGELTRFGKVALAKAEVAWLAGDGEGVVEATEATLALALEREWGALAGELAAWRRRAGRDTPAAEGVEDPHALELAGNWQAAGERWLELGCPYEGALALLEVDDENALRRAHDLLQELEARPAAAIVARRLRERGARGLPRGPRTTTKENPGGLTARELEVLGLLTGGLRNAEIAARLVLSERTVGHHVGAILRKLAVQTRAQAAAEAVRLGVGAPR